MDYRSEFVLLWQDLFNVIVNVLMTEPFIWIVGIVILYFIIALVMSILNPIRKEI